MCSHDQATPHNMPPTKPADARPPTATCPHSNSNKQRAQLFSHGRELAERAAITTPGQFAHHLTKLTQVIAADTAIARSEQQRSLATLSHGINNETGMGWIRADLHPDDYQKFKRKLNTEITALNKRPEHHEHRYDQIAANAFMSLTTSTRAAASPAPSTDATPNSTAAKYTTSPNGTNTPGTPTWPTCFPRAPTTTIEPTKADGNSNSTRTLDNSPSPSPTEHTTVPACPTSSPNALTPHERTNVG